MKRTIYLFVFVLFAFFCGCHSQQRDVELLNPETPFSSISDFESFAKSHPDSALQLLGSDLERPETKADKADSYYKTLLYSEIRLKKFFPPESDTLPLAVVAYYDSIFYADSTGKADRRAFMQNQWLRARAHFVLGTAEQAGYEYMKAMQHHLTALRILDAYFADSDSRSIMLLRGNIDFYIGDVLYYMENQGLASKLYFNSLSYYLKTDDSAAIARAYWSIGGLLELIESKEHKDTIIYFAKQGLSYVNEQEHPFECALLLGIFGNYYRYYGVMDSAILYFNKAIEIIPEEYDNRYMLYTSLGCVYYFEENYDTTLYWLLKGFEAKEIFRKHTASIGLSAIYSEMSDNEKYIQYSDYQTKLQSKIDQINLSNANVSVLYDNYIQDRNKQQAAQKATYYTKIIVVCILIAVGLVFLGFYLRNRFKIKRLKKEIAQKTQEIGKMQQHQSKQGRWNNFVATNIYATIKQKCNEQDIYTKTIENIQVALTETEWEELQFTIDSVFNNFSERLLKDYPKLTQADLNYGYLTLLQLTEAQKAALMGQDYDAIAKRKQRLEKEKLKTKNIYSILKKHL